MSVGAVGFTLPKPDVKISKYFTVREAFLLPRWHRLPLVGKEINEEQYNNVVRFLRDFIDPVREFMRSSMIVHVCFRSPEYNRLIGGARRSAHLALNGEAAIDFHFKDYGCDLARRKLLPELERFKLRMEDNPGSGWVHLDNRIVTPKGSRFFRP